MVAVIDAKKGYDSVGGIFEVIATGVPYGPGSYSQWNNEVTSTDINDDDEHQCL